MARHEPRITITPTPVGNIDTQILYDIELQDMLVDLARPEFIEVWGTSMVNDFRRRVLHGLVFHYSALQDGYDALRASRTITRQSTPCGLRSILRPIQTYRGERKLQTLDLQLQEKKKELDDVTEVYNRACNIFKRMQEKYS